MAMTARTTASDGLIRRLDQAVATQDVDQLCGEVFAYATLPCQENLGV